MKHSWIISFLGHWTTKKGHAKRKIFAVDMVADMVSQPNASVKFAVAMGYGGDV